MSTIKTYIKDSLNYNKSNKIPSKQHLYDPELEHDSCGVGFVVNINGIPEHSIVRDAVKILLNLEHRGAVGGDSGTGDGAGLTLQVPYDFFSKIAEKESLLLPEQGKYAVAMVFFPNDKVLEESCRIAFEKEMLAEKMVCLGWRDVPCDDSSLGELAKSSQPIIKQAFITSVHYPKTQDEFEFKLYVLRRRIEKAIAKASPEMGNDFYISSLSSRTIVYKGMLLARQLPDYYLDLKDESVKSAMAMAHQRYSTNTFPSWALAQPFRYLAHNGEINTLRGNLNHMRSREKSLASQKNIKDISKVLPVIHDEAGSDSACLDNALELIHQTGRSLSHSMIMLIPQPWGEKYSMSPDLRGFLEYHAGLMEPWDGPAAVCFTNGVKIGAVSDRNGLRPSRYTVTKDGKMVLGSETGLLKIAPENIKEQGILRPGEMLLVDTEKQRILYDNELKTILSRKNPYRRWVKENQIAADLFTTSVSTTFPKLDSLLFRQRLFGFTREDLSVILNPMALNGKEPIGSMGNDTPLAVFSEKPQLLFSYFRQLFAQITNPAIDPIREELVMSLMTFIGNPGNILSEIPSHAKLIKLKHPILTLEDMHRVQSLPYKEFQSVKLTIGFKAGGDGADLQKALKELAVNAYKATKEGKSIIILSDDKLPENIVPIPSLIAVSTVNQYLIKKGVRTKVALLVETGEAREVMHFALLLGYGASAIYPYVALETLDYMAATNRFTRDVGGQALANTNYIKAVCKGLLKVMSKMGISVLRSYRSAQIFEAIGLSSEVIDEYFPRTASRVGGIGLSEIAKEANERYKNAYDSFTSNSKLLETGGSYKYRKDGERHLWTADSISKLQKSTRENDYKLYKEYAALINNQEKQLSTLRGMFKFKKVEAISLDEVEPASEIMKRFVTGAMSFGSISREAHETLAIAMNRIGGKSNSGEGGEDSARFIPMPNGDSKCSAIKQIASGRFGVTTEYLVNAQELQIKIAQGAKPGEGGQLPGHKVNTEIAKVRHSTRGVTLISPPPHHDIYSIEDIAQLIFDLKNVNPVARVSVKLVSEVGVGTIAAGVSKAHSDMVLISGHDGGTGASPLSSIKHTGGPWEIGLAETQQTLVLNNLRDRIRLQVDGQLKTGRDLVIGAMLGAEEFGFATTALVVCGCVMMRKCHNNTCPVGVATQDPRLRKLFTGKPEHVVNFLRMIAEEAREYMAELGIRKIDELVGRNDLLEVNEAVDFWKAKGLDFSNILDYTPPKDAPLYCKTSQNHGIDNVLDIELIKKAKAALESEEKVVIESKIKNSNRTLGTMLSGEVAKRYGFKGLKEDTITLKISGSAGQSFASFGAHGITFILSGEANDYLGKGLSGAKIILKPFEGGDFIPENNVIAGNVICYGATSGEIYISGTVGERFCIRNSGVKAVVEGVGGHACEYMTGGTVVVLGETGLNFAAGMSGGFAYVYDPKSVFDNHCNLGMVDLEMVTNPKDVKELKRMIKKHFKYTNSRVAKTILDDWEASLPHFIKVFPMEYKRVLGEMTKEDQETEREELENG